MKLSRRDFLRLASFSTLGAVACNFFDEREFVSQSPVQLPEDLVTGRDNWYATLSRQCIETEGIVVRVMEGRAKKVQGNPQYPTNLGGHSLRSEAGLQALYHPERISGPLLRQGPRGTGRYDPVSWNEALDRLRGHLQAQADRSRVLTVTGPLRGSMAHLVSSFADSYGARHVAFQPMEDTAYDHVMKDVLGQQTAPTFDFKNANYVLSFGADFLGTWKAPVQVLPRATANFDRASDANAAEPSSRSIPGSPSPPPTPIPGFPLTPARKASSPSASPTSSSPRASSPGANQPTHRRPGRVRPERLRP